MHYRMGEERMIMHTVQKHYDDVNRGDLLVTAGGCVVADTLSAAGLVEKPEPFWYDTDGKRHFPNPTDGTLTVRVAAFRTQSYGQDRNGRRHALLNPVPDRLPRAYCGDAPDSDLAVWESGTALASVTCPDCRRGISLVNTGRKRESNGI